MYDGDTFFHLSVAGRVGLITLSLILTLGTLWAFARISSRFGLIVKLFLAIILLWLFIWLSPQIYYTYYWFLFDDLPVQIVVQSPPGPREMARLITFTGPANLSAHGKGMLFWLMALFAVSGAVYPKRP